MVRNSFWAVIRAFSEVFERHSARSVQPPVLRPRLIVFAGPPCSGKSPLSKRLEKKIPGACRFEMDEVRKKVQPDSDQSKADRNVAYRAMHALAHEELMRGRQCVILDATYSPPEHRDGLATLAKRHDANVYLVECRVEPEDAVLRLRQKPPAHGAVDLTESRVRSQARDYAYYGGGMPPLNTSEETSSEDKCERQIIEYLERQVPLWSPEDWANAARVALQATSGASSSQANHPKKISPQSRRKALRHLVFLYILLGGSIFMALAGLIAFLLRLIGGIAVCREHAYGLKALYKCPLESNDSLLMWATALFAGAVVSAGVIPIWELFVKPGGEEAKAILRAGRTPRFEPFNQLDRTNREIYREYHQRLQSRDERKLLCIPAVPIYFVIQPAKDKAFDVTVQPTNSTLCERNVSTDAAKLGLDWTGFREWAIERKAREFYGKRIWERMLRVNGLRPVNGGYVVNGSPLQFSEYLCREQCVNLELPGHDLYMREFFEGERWSRKALSLNNVAEAGRRYAMLVSVNALITTSDNYLVLQRRSGLVTAGAGGAGTSTGGFAEWSDISGASLYWKSLWKEFNWRPHSLVNSILREIFEEIGLAEDDLCDTDAPFLAAAYNLKYGRDLNFYAHFRYSYDHFALAHRFDSGYGLWNRIYGFARGLSKGTWVTGFQKDKWEVAHIFFVPLSAVNKDNGDLEHPFDKMIGDARHLRGALYSFAKSGRLLRCLDSSSSSS